MTLTVILETDANNRQQNRYIKGINYIGVIGKTNKEIFYVYNSHGDVTLTITPTWKVLNQYDYDIFGNITLEIETHENAIKYAGEFYDNETGFYYLRARYYNPHTARFISEDSYWGEDTNPLSLNLYTYCYNNPVKYVDPSGHKVSDWDRNNLSEGQRKEITRLTNVYDNKSLSWKERHDAHKAAEAIRNTKRTANLGGIGKGDTIDLTSKQIVTDKIVNDDRTGSGSRTSTSTHRSNPPAPAIDVDDVTKKVDDPSLANEVLDSAKAPDSLFSYVATTTEEVTEAVAKKIYHSPVTNSSSKVEAYNKLAVVANKADAVRRAADKIRTVGKWGGVAGAGIMGGLDMYDDLTNPNFDSKDKAKAVAVDALATGATIAAGVVVGGIATVISAPVVATVAITTAVGIAVGGLIGWGAKKLKGWFIND